MVENHWPNAVAKACIVVGSSRGLGSALVDALLANGADLVVGVARTSEHDIAQRHQWPASPRYRHIQIDIGSPDSVAAMSAVLPDMPKEPLLVIFNAANLAKDTKDDRSIDFEVFEEINRTGVNGFTNVLRAFEPHLLSWGGTFVGISSINALMPPVLEHRVAYPATKAFLHMALRSAGIAWEGKVSCVTIHLGHVGGALNRGLVSRLLLPTYAATADKIVRLMMRQNIPRQMTYPFLYRVMYRGILPYVPDSTYYHLLRLLVRVGRSR